MSVNVLIFTDCLSKAFARSAGAYRVATELRKHGYTVQVVDHFLCLNLDKILAILNKFVDDSTLIVGFASNFLNIKNGDFLNAAISKERFSLSEAIYPNTTGFTSGIPLQDHILDIIKYRIRTLSPKAKLVLGGSKADFATQSQIDAFVQGYADNSILSYLKYLEGKNPFFQFTSLPTGQIIINYDLNAEAFDFQHSVIDYHASDLIRQNEVLPIEVARGCIFKCKFCAFKMTGKKKLDYIKTDETLYKEFMQNYEKFGTTKYIFADDTYNDSVQKLEMITNVSRRLPFKLEYVAYIRHDLVHKFPEQADLLLESGLKSAVFGIETLNHSAGTLIGKGLHPDKTRELLYWLKEDKKWSNNILMSSGFIFGLPKDSPDIIRSWADEIIDKNYPLDSFIFSPLALYPYSPRLSKSEFELEHEKYGYSVNPDGSGWINEFWTYSDAASLAREYQNEAYFSGRIKTFGFVAMMLHNYGYTWEQLHRQSGNEIEKGVAFKTFELADDYYEKLIRL